MSSTHTVPTGATYATIYWPNFAGIQEDNLVLGTVTSADVVTNDPYALPDPAPHRTTRAATTRASTPPTSTKRRACRGR